MYIAFHYSFYFSVTINYRLITIITNKNETSEKSSKTEFQAETVKSFSRLSVKSFGASHFYIGLRRRDSFSSFKSHLNFDTGTFLKFSVGAIGSCGARFSYYFCCPLMSRVPCRTALYRREVNRFLKSTNNSIIRLLSPEVKFRHSFD